MSTHNWESLVQGGRAKALGVPWEDEELIALLELEKVTGQSKVVLAPYVRNGVKTIEEYEKALAKDLQPPTLEEVALSAKQAFQKKLNEGEPKKSEPSMVELGQAKKAKKK